MEIRYEKRWSRELNRDMEFKIYGSRGLPVLYIPCQAGRFWDFESFHMTDTFAPWIESGEVMAFSCDTIDNEAWAAEGQDCRRRIENHERWFRYLTLELVPGIFEIADAANGSHRGILTFGASMGGMHAANLYYRRPDLFCGCFAISGIYDNSLFFGDYCDDLVYNNCPAIYLPNLPRDHFYRELYRQGKSLIVVGQGAWEEPLLASTRRLEDACRRGDIPTRFEYWGSDVAHDWYWWHEMVRTYLPWLLN